MCVPAPLALTSVLTQNKGPDTEPHFSNPPALLRRASMPPPPPPRQSNFQVAKPLTIFCGIPAAAAAAVVVVVVVVVQHQGPARSVIAWPWTFGSLRYTHPFWMNPKSDSPKYIMAARIQRQENCSRPQGGPEAHPPWQGRQDPCQTRQGSGGRGCYNRIEVTSVKV